MTLGIAKKRRFEIEPHPKHAVASDSRKQNDFRFAGASIDRRFRVLPDYYGLC